MNEQTAITTSSAGEFLAPVANVRQALERYQAVKDFIGQVLKPGTDYGAIPGAGDKPALLKPGAEKMCSFFGLTPRIIESERVEDWTGKDHDGEPFFYYRYRIGLFRGERLIAEGEGSANSWEKKYRYRNGERVCPNCGKPAIIIGKKEYGGGFICFAKKGGCGSKFGDKDPQIIGQEVGQVKNPDIADVVNTLQKMAQKRALIAPVLIATNTSDYFTQDIEDFIHPGEIITEGHAADVITEQTAQTSGVKSKPVTQPRQAQPAQMSYEIAATRKTPGGTEYRNLTKEQLQTIIDGMSKPESKEAAKLVLEHDHALVYDGPNDLAVISQEPDPRTGDGENR